MLPWAAGGTSEMAEPIRILHVYKDIYPPVVGGIERHIHSIRCALPEFQHDVLVCAHGPRTQVRSIPAAHPGREVHVGEFGRWLSTPVAPAFPIWFNRMARGSIVHLHMPQPLAELTVALSRKRWPLVASYHADIYRQRALLPLYQTLLSRCLRSADVVIAASRVVRDTSPVLKSAGVRPVVVPYAIDPTRWGSQATDPNRINALRNQYGGAFVIAVGRLVHYKGFDDLIASAQHFDAQVVIVGDGPLRPALEQHVRRLELQDRVHLVGQASDSELAAHLAAAAVFVLPSTNRAEAFGISILEAQASGLPVVVTDVGTGTVEAFEPGETGILIPSCDRRRLGEAIARLIGDSGLRSRMGAAGQLRVANEHSLAKLASRLRPLYARLSTFPAVAN